MNSLESMRVMSSVPCDCNVLRAIAQPLAEDHHVIPFGVIVGHDGRLLGGVLEIELARQLIMRERRGFDKKLAAMAGANVGLDVRQQLAADSAGLRPLADGD